MPNFKRGIVPVRPYKTLKTKHDAQSANWYIDGDGQEHIIVTTRMSSSVKVLFVSQFSRHELDKKPCRVAKEKFLFPWKRRRGSALVTGVVLREESALLLRDLLNEIFLVKKEPSVLEKVESILSASFGYKSEDERSLALAYVQHTEQK